MPTKCRTHRPRFSSKPRRADRRGYDEARGSSSQRGYDAAWQKFRAAYARNVAAPLCEACGAVMPSRQMHLDHIVPISQGGDRLDSGNCQWLCARCHLHKTRAESRAAT